jgi:serine/threonine protein kinase
VDPRSTPTSPASPLDLSTVPPELAAHPDYELQKQLGRGGMGMVYLARNRLMDRLEVIKVVHPGLLDSGAARERFLQEIRAAARLRHVNVVTAYSVLQGSELLGLAMEYVDGTDLARLVQSKGPLPVAHACQYARQAALGLQHAFGEGMVHRDVKPHNLLLSRKGELKVADFGLAKIAEQGGGLTRENAAMGTPEYIAPEQALDARKADTRSDVYSLGCTLYFLLTGRPPFPDDTPMMMILSHLEKQPAPVRSLRPEVSPELAEVVAKMMAKRPEDRYQTPAEVAQALLPYTRARGRPLAAAAPFVPPSETPTKPALEKTVLESLPLPADRSGALPAAGRSGKVPKAVTPFPVEAIPLPDEPIPLPADRPSFLWRAIRGIFALLWFAVRPMFRPILTGVPWKGIGATALALIAVGAIVWVVALGTGWWKLVFPPAEAGFESVFTGRNLDGWRVDHGDEVHWKAEGGELIVRGAGWANCSRLVLGRDLGDFVLRGEFRLADPDAASVIEIRGERDEYGKDDVPTPLGLRVGNRPNLPTGNLYWTKSTSTHAQRPLRLFEPKAPPAWNELELEVKGSWLKFSVNGEVLQDRDLAILEKDENALPALSRRSGRLALYSHTGEVRFRNLRVRETAATSAASGAKAPGAPSMPGGTAGHEP